ncbi:MAG: nucleotidyltransferase domain-containing protein [bacterium]|nr:nucleotidyltransferase domain-containing protein [bacterium]
MAKKTIKKEIKNTLSKYRERLENSGIPVEHMILFGSYARGKAKKDSDIDICIVSPKLGKDEMAEIGQLNFLHWKLDNRIEAHPVSSKDYKTIATPFISEIQKYGIKI